MLEHTYISPRAASYLVGLVNPFQGAGLTIDVICSLQCVCTLLLGYGQNGVRLLLLYIILQAGLQRESILLQAESCNPQLLNQVVPAVNLAIRNSVDANMLLQKARLGHRLHVEAEIQGRQGVGNDMLGN